MARTRYPNARPRRPRVATGGDVYHALNRAVGRSTIYETVGDYPALEQVIEEAREQVAMRLLSFCVMPNHWHLVLWPREDGGSFDLPGLAHQNPYPPLALDAKVGGDRAVVPGMLPVV